MMEVIGFLLLVAVWNIISSNKAKEHEAREKAKEAEEQWEYDKEESRSYYEQREVCELDAVTSFSVDFPSMTCESWYLIETFQSTTHYVIYRKDGPMWYAVETKRIIELPGKDDEVIEPDKEDWEDNNNPDPDVEGSAELDKCTSAKVEVAYQKYLAFHIPRAK